MKQRYYGSAIAIAAVAAALVGCGGGGGGGGSSTPVTPGSGPFANMKTNSFVFDPISSSPTAPIPVYPSSGTYQGGTVVTINGSGQLTAPVTVYFGDTPGVNTLVVSNSSSSTSINVQSPAGTPATTVDVRVVDANGVSATSTNDHYFFVPPPPAPPAPPVTGSSVVKPAH